ncbi:DUF2490 domain-containing protein [uncultured Polaribacter sp.]|uniref:DUF2490 domain-containing protein n=1 Tax=uncultured Polaribacter sp. TaxID=174711 RepID=UPI00261EC02D|nr:DUF2490 domain-containing protein [uncultured Polaribacter sp.]
MKNTIKKILLVILVLFTTINYAQTEGDTDWASWNTVGVDYKLNNKLSFGFAGQLRFKENISVVDEYFTELSGAYKLFKGFKIGAGLRYISENDNTGNVQGYDNYFRFNIDASYKHQIKNFKLGYRLRYQNKNEIGVSYAEGDFVNQNLRFKTSIEYDINNWKLDPKFSAEIFNRFQEGKDNGFNKYRLTLGTDYNLKDFGKIGAFYRIEKELNVDLPDTKNIVGLKYIYRFKNK